jgi:adenosine deaminase
MSRLKDEAFRAEERGHDLASYDQRYDALVAVFRAVDAYRALVQPPDP